MTTVSLGTPLRLPASGQELPNRIMKAALSEALADDRALPGTRLEQLYRRWSSGGYGLQITGNVMVDGEHLGEPGNVVLEDQIPLDGFRRWAKTAQDGGGRIWMQLNHPGRQANPMLSRNRAVAPSAIGMDIPGAPQPRALSEAGIVGIIDRFAEAAELAEQAGFDGVQIHGAHGYLVSQFLSPLANQRTDSWGGPIGNRARFALEIIAAIRERVSPAFAVGIKLNSADFQRGGFGEDDSRAVIEMLADQPIDLLEISGGSYESPAMVGRPRVSDSTRAREAYFLEYAAAVRSLVPDIPLAVTGGFRTRQGMAEALSSGDCDVIGIGRPTTLAPDAAHELIGEIIDELPTRQLALPVPRALAGNGNVKSLEGLLDLQWHADQMHRMADGSEPDISRQVWKAAATSLRRNGLGSLRGRRRSVAPSAPSTSNAVKKFRFERAVGRYVANPLVGAAGRLGIRTSLAADLETVGRRFGQRRVVPVAAAFDQDGTWIISQHGRRSGWALNIADEPRVRIRQGSRWRTAVACFEPDDDVPARARSFASAPVFAGLVAATFRALQSDPISVRLTFDDESEGRDAGMVP